MTGIQMRPRIAPDDCLPGAIPDCRRMRPVILDIGQHPDSLVNVNVGRDAVGRSKI
jgi:hypothetical protein